MGLTRAPARLGLSEIPTGHNLFLFTVFRDFKGVAVGFAYAQTGGIQMVNGSLETGYTFRPGWHGTCSMTGGLERIWGDV